LQAYLTKIVSNATFNLGTTTRYLEAHVSNKDLRRLSHSEHPVLRAAALSIMTERAAFNNYDVVMSHLDDTAQIAIDGGEFGIWFRTVSDNLILHSTWKNSAEKKQTVDQVITKHNYLESAYTILLSIEADPKYYPFIKKMEQQKNDFTYKEYALFGLAKYKKETDVAYIKNNLMENFPALSSVSFRLMQEYPNEIYMEILDKYAKRALYSRICNRGKIEDATSFFHTVASYKNEKSAEILEAILSKKPFIKCRADTNYLKRELSYAIWKNQCFAYAKIMNQIKTYILEYRIEQTLPLKYNKEELSQPIHW
jgi:hypothetical protein